MSSFADLHIHSYFSDGSDSPQDIVAKAKQNGLAAISLTDHDTVEGMGPALAAGQEHGIEVIAGIEFSAEIEDRDVHILGYFLDVAHPRLNERIRQFQTVRGERIEKMLLKLAEEGVKDISAEEVFRLTRSGSVGRPHLALLLQQKGWVKDNTEAFAKYLGEDCAAYVPKYKQTPFEAIELIREAGGVAVLAHPMVTNKDEIIPQLVAAGLGGIEIVYPNCTESVTAYYEKLTKKHGLVRTGGSDYHGEARSYIYVGKAKVPGEWVEELRARAKNG